MLALRASRRSSRLTRRLSRIVWRVCNLYSSSPIDRQGSGLRDVADEVPVGDAGLGVSLFAVGLEDGTAVDAVVLVAWEPNENFSMSSLIYVMCGVGVVVDPVVPYVQELRRENFLICAISKDGFVFANDVLHFQQQHLSFLVWAD